MQRTKSLREAVTGGAAKGQHGAGTPTSASCAAWIRWKSPRRHHDRGCLARPRKRTASTIAPCSRPSTRRGSYGTRCGPRRASVSQRARRRGGARCGRRCAGEVSEHVLHGKGVERGWDSRPAHPVTPPPRPKEAACGLGAACKPADNGRLQAVPKRRANRTRARIAARAGATTTARPQPVGRVSAGRLLRSPCHSHARTVPCARAARQAR